MMFKYNMKEHIFSNIKVLRKFITCELFRLKSDKSHLQLKKYTENNHVS